MGDDWFGHRDPLTGAPEGDSGEWTEWDYLLIRTHQTIEDYTNQHGLLVWEVDDPQERVEVDAIRKTDRFEAAKERKTGGKNYKPSPGEYFVPRVRKISEEWPTLREYIQHQIEEES